MTRGNPNIRLLILVAIFLMVLAGLFITQPLATAAVLSSGIRQSTPLVLGALCGLFCERSGVMNLGIEGQMLFSAYVGFMVSVWTGSLLMGVSAAVICGAMACVFLAIMAIHLKTDQIIAGTVVNILAVGLTGYFYPMGAVLTHRLEPLSLPFLSRLPRVGHVLFDIPPITLVTLFIVFISHVLLFRTRWGLRTRSVGEHPAAADSMGIRVNAVRFSRVVFAGCFAGLAGAFLSLEAVGAFERGMTNGRGFIALAVLILGRWRPLGVWGAALVFGIAMALQTQVQFFETIRIPHQFTGMLPYLATLLALVFFVRDNPPPKALGRVFDKTREG